jgi:hypothetical protein
MQPLPHFVKGLVLAALKPRLRIALLVSMFTLAHRFGVVPDAAGSWTTTLVTGHRLWNLRQFRPCMA